LNDFQTPRKNEQTTFAVYYTIISLTKMSINPFQFAKGSLEDACHRSSPLNNKFESEKLNIPEINYTKDVMKKDIESIGRWYNIRRDKILRDLIKLDEDYQQMVQEHTHKWTEQIEKLYATESGLGLEQEHSPVWQKKCRVMRAMSDGELIPTDIGLFNKKRGSDETSHKIFTLSKGFHLNSSSIYKDELDHDIYGMPLKPDSEESNGVESKNIFYSESECDYMNVF